MFYNYTALFCEQLCNSATQNQNRLILGNLNSSITHALKLLDVQISSFVNLQVSYIDFVVFLSYKFILVENNYFYLDDS